MFGSITTDGGFVVICVIVAVTVFFALLAIISEFVANKKEEAVARKEAKLSGETYDEVNGAISQNMFWG